MISLSLFFSVFESMHTNSICFCCVFGMWLWDASFSILNFFIFNSMKKRNNYHCLYNMLVNSNRNWIPLEPAYSEQIYTFAVQSGVHNKNHDIVFSSIDVIFYVRRFVKSVFITIVQYVKKTGTKELQRFVQFC